MPGQPGTAPASAGQRRQATASAMSTATSAGPRPSSGSGLGAPGAAPAASKHGNFRDSMVAFAKRIQHSVEHGLENLQQVGAPNRHSTAPVPTSTSTHHRQLAEEARRRSSTSARADAQQKSEGAAFRARERRGSNSDLAVAMRQRGGIQRRPPPAAGIPSAVSGSPGGEKAKVGGRGGKCPNGHKLERVGLERDNGWACDGRLNPGGCKSGIRYFHQSHGVNRFRCWRCDFDVCEACVKAADEPIEIEMLPMSRSKPLVEGAPALGGGAGRGVLDGLQTFLQRGVAGVGASLDFDFSEGRASPPLRSRSSEGRGARAPAAAGGGAGAGEQEQEEAEEQAGGEKGRRVLPELARSSGSLVALATPARRRSTGSAPAATTTAALLRDSDAVTALKHRFAAWASSDPDAEQVRMTSMQILRSAPSDSPTGGMAPTQLEVSCIIEGVEVVFEVLCSPRDDKEILRNFAEVDLLMSSARTQCRWPSAAAFVQSSIEAARGRQLEDFLTCLLNKFLAGSLAKTPVESHRTSLEGTAGGSQQATRRCSSIDEKSWAIDSHSPSSLASRSSDSADSEDETTVEQSFGDAWAKWVMERPPLLRFQHASKDLAWEFPLSKAEKQELLMLQVFAQEAQNKREIEEAQRRRQSRLSRLSNGTARSSVACEEA